MRRVNGRRVNSNPGERGLTLIELMIAVTLVAALMTGLLMVMRTAMITYEKVNRRLQDNRRVMGLQQALQRQVAGLIPVMAFCAGPAGVMMGDEASLRFVSSDSLSEGARGYPRMIEYRAAQDPNGGVRLMMTENLYNGVLPPAPCGGGAAMFSGEPLPGQQQNQSVEMAGKLAFCRFGYQDVVPDTLLGGPWLPSWSLPRLPVAVRIEMAPMNPAASDLPTLTLNVPLRITRQIGTQYADQ